MIVRDSENKYGVKSVGLRIPDGEGVLVMCLEEGNLAIVGHEECL